MAKINGAIVKLIIPKLIGSVCDSNLETAGIDITENYDRIETENYDSSVREFITNHIRYTVNPNDVITIWELKRAYDNFCIIHGYRPMHDMIQFLDTISRFTNSRQLKIPYEPWLIGDHGFTKVKLIGNLDPNIIIIGTDPKTRSEDVSFIAHGNEDSVIKVDDSNEDHKTDLRDDGAGSYTDIVLHVRRGSTGKIIWDQEATDQYRRMRPKFSAEEFAKLYKVSPSTIAKYDILFIKKGQTTSGRRSKHTKANQKEPLPNVTNDQSTVSIASKFNASSPITITSNDFRDALTFLTTLICNDIYDLKYFETICKGVSNKSPKNRTVGDFKYSIRNAVSNSIMRSIGVSKKKKMYIIPDFPKREEDTATWEMIFWIHLKLQDLKNKNSKEVMKIYYESRLGLNVGLSKKWIEYLRQGILSNVKNSKKDENLQNVLDELETTYCQR
ncbi:MAG: hypothetical protein NC489_11610 [Ruminococcus flavefaciens]|nr:hypothetical protein [Ruminococcus flavefaciens]